MDRPWLPWGAWRCAVVFLSAQRHRSVTVHQSMPGLLCHSGLRGGRTRDMVDNGGRGFRLWRFIFLGCSQGMEETKQDTPLCPSPSCSCPVAQGQDSNQMLRTGSPEPTFVPHPESDGFRCTPLFSQVWLRYPKVQKMTLGGTEARNEVTGKSQSLFNQHSDLTNDQGSTEEGWRGGDYAFNPCNNRWSSGPGTHTHCGQ